MEDKVKLKQTGVKVRFIGEDGNAFAILGRVSRTLRRTVYGREFIKAFMDGVANGNYKCLLVTVKKDVEVE